MNDRKNQTLRMGLAMTATVAALNGTFTSAHSQPITEPRMCTYMRCTQVRDYSNLDHLVRIQLRNAIESNAERIRHLVGARPNEQVVVDINFEIRADGHINLLSANGRAYGSNRWVDITETLSESIRLAIPPIGICRGSYSHRILPPTIE